MQKWNKTLQKWAISPQFLFFWGRGRTTEKPIGWHWVVHLTSVGWASGRGNLIIMVTWPGWPTWKTDCYTLFSLIPWKVRHIAPFWCCDHNSSVTPFKFRQVCWGSVPELRERMASCGLFLMPVTPRKCHRAGTDGTFCIFHSALHIEIDARFVWLLKKPEGNSIF